MQPSTAFVIGWKLTLALIAGIPILTTIAVYCLARFTSAFDAYAGERAKLIAQFHNLDKLVEQTEKLTATTETIKAQISDQVWDRQMRWNFKRDMYITLMETLGLHQSNHERNMLLEMTRRRDPNNPLYPMIRDEAIRRSTEVQADLVRVACSAPLIISAEAHQIVIDTRDLLREIDFDNPAFSKDCKHNVAVLQDGLDKLLLAAQRDLDIQAS